MMSAFQQVAGSWRLRIAFVLPVQQKYMYYSTVLIMLGMHSGLLYIEELIMRALALGPLHSNPNFLILPYS